MSNAGRKVEYAWSSPLWKLLSLIVWYSKAPFDSLVGSPKELLLLQRFDVCLTLEVDASIISTDIWVYDELPDAIAETPNILCTLISSFTVSWSTQSRICLKSPRGRRNCTRFAIGFWYPSMFINETR